MDRRTGRRGRRQRLRRSAGIAAFAVCAMVTGCAGPSQAVGPSWEGFVPAPGGTTVRPVAAFDATRGVRGVGTVVGGAGSVTLTDRPGRSAPSFVVDYGRDVAGVPFFVVRSVTGSPTLSAAYSEGRQYLGPAGDGSPSASNAGDASRADSLVVAYPGRMTTGLIQGGERYERITLTSPGSVTLSQVGIDSTAGGSAVRDYRGWFDSSSRALDRIWYDGAYTTQLDELPARSVPPAWRIRDGVLEAAPGEVGLLARGSGWSDYTMAFDTRVLNRSAGWVVRAHAPSSGYLFLLQAPAKGQGSRPTLLEAALGPGEFSTIGTVTLPRGMNVSRWQHVSTVVSGTRITTSVDGRQVAAFNLDTLPSGTSVYPTGTVGFATVGATAMFRDLDVTGSDGNTLYTNDLSRSAALADFPGQDVTSPDMLPAVVDGAKRDRVVWSGDLGTEAPTIFLSTDDASYVRGSLQILASSQVADGETGTNVDPTAPLGAFPAQGTPYSTSYSMDTVNDLALYYRSTGDLGFIRDEWPMVTRELAYDRTLVDGRGLLVTDAQDGQDWDYYDGARTGEVTAYNVIYYQTLTDAATMAGALGLAAQAALYRSEALGLRSAINRYLFDPSTGLYGLSNLEPAVVAQDANSLAVIDGVAPPGVRPEIVSRMVDVLPTTPFGPDAFTANAGYRPQVSPFVTSEEVQAMFMTGHSADALSLITKLWGHMDSPGPDDTSADWELVGADGQPGFGSATSLAHGWSSGATADLSSYVLGVLPDAAGYGRWTVQPHPGTLSWSEGSVPTPGGAITVRWTRGAPSGRFALRVSSPSGTRGVISVPVPTSGSEVTARASRHGQSVRRPLVIRTPSGAHYQAITATGGVTYDITVAPESPARG